MNKKNRIRVVTPLLLLTLSFSSVAQKFNTSISTTYKHETLQDLHSSGNELISFEKTDRKTKYGANINPAKLLFGIKLSANHPTNLSVIRESQLFNGEKVCGPLHSSIQSINDKLWLFYSVYDKSSKNVISLMAARIDPASLTIGEPKQLLQIDPANTRLLTTIFSMEMQTLLIKRSPDKSKVLVFWASNRNDQCFISVFNPELELIWSRKETIGGKETTITSACVDNSGNVYAGYDFTVGGANYRRQISVFRQQSAPLHMEIQTGDSHPYDVIVLAAKKGDVVHVTGTYGSSVNSLTGVYSQTISTSDFKPSPMILKDFTPEFVKELAKDTWASTQPKKYGLESITMQAHELEDGSIGLVGQFRRSTTTEKNYYSITGSIVNVRLNGSDALFGWIPKYRVSAGSTIGDFYSAFPYKNQLLIFYNDEARNLEKAIGEKYSTANVYTNHVLVVAYMDAGGQVKREKLIDLVNEGFLPLGEKITPVSPASLMVPIVKVKSLGRDGKESKTGVITIE